MKIFAIRDESAEVRKDLAYLLYFETEKSFYIELPENADRWELPLLLESFVKDGETSVNSYWSKIWVQQRIIPPDRQNIGEILRDNGFEEYDEYQMLMLAMGRCAQDDCYLEPLTGSQLPGEIVSRFEKKLEDVLPLDDFSLLAFFRDGTVKKCRMKEYFSNRAELKVLLQKQDWFEQLRMLPGGYGVWWDTGRAVSDAELYRIGTLIPLTVADFKNFAVQRVVNAAEAAELLGCSRQNIDYLTKHGKLHPIKATGKNTLYLKSEILKRNWE